MAAKKKPAKPAKKAPPKAAAKKVVKKAAKRPAKAKPAAKAKKAIAKKRVSAVPAGHSTATPYLVVRGAAAALEFYAKAFGAKEKSRMEMPGGGIGHAEMKVVDSMIMLSDENPQWGAVSPLTLGGNGTSVMLYVKNADAFVARAVAAGATVTMPLSDMFWGDRFGKIKDPFGHEWSIATHIEDVSSREMKKRSEAWAKSMAEQPQG